MKGGNNYSPLEVAIKYESPEAIKLFLQCKIRDPAAWEKWLERGLLYAASSGHRDAVLQILKAGANINALQEEGYAKGATALLLAIFSGEIKTAQLLIRQGQFLGWKFRFLFFSDSYQSFIGPQDLAWS
jgi:ankyrin repeat protein